jgi:hypothetical protein
VLKPAVRTMLVPVPRAAGKGAGTGQTISIGAQPLRDTELLAWCEELIVAVLSGIPQSQQGEKESRRDQE